MIYPIEGNLFDLPDYKDIQDEKFLLLPPPEFPGGDAEANLVNGEPEGNKSLQSKNSSGTSRRAVKRPLPKLDAQRYYSTKNNT